MTSSWAAREGQETYRQISRFFLLTSITCFSCLCHTGGPSCDPINLGAGLLSALSGTLISACDEGEGGLADLFFIFSSQR